MIRKWSGIRVCLPGGRIEIALENLLLLADARTARVLVTVLLFALGLGFLFVARATLIAFLFAIFFAYLMSPAVNRLETLLRGRARAIAVIYSLLLVLVVGFFVLVGPKVTREGAKMGQSLPTVLAQLKSGQLANQLGEEHGWNQRYTLLAQSFLVSHSEEIAQLAQRVGFRVADVAKEAWLFFVVPLLSIFFLKDGRSFSDFLISAIQSRPQREFLENVLNDLNQMLAHFIRAQLTLAALTLVMYSAVLGIMRVPYALVLGTLGGLLEFIPVVGPLAAALVIVSVALVMSYKHWLILIIFLGIWRLLQDYVSSPRIMGESMELHPLAAIFGVMAGGEVAGILGIYLSIPVMASLRIVLRRWRLYAEKKKFGPLTEYPFRAQETHRP
jgi:predicted PurR-regulated permease PerM